MTLTATIQSLALQHDGSANVVLSVATTGAQLLINVAAADLGQYPLGGNKTITIS